MQKTMKRVSALAIVFAMLVAFMSMLGTESAFAEEVQEEEAKTIKVFMTVSIAGVIAKTNDDDAMAWKEVIVTDLDKDGKFTFDEALVAAHKKYNKEDGYNTTGSSVKKLWGIATSNSLFFIDGEGIPAGVTVDEVEAGDHLTASVMADETYYSDWVSKFDRYEVVKRVGDEMYLSLDGHLGMAWTEEEKEDEPLQGVQLGIWKDGAVTPIEGAVTDEDGEVELSFDEPGTYVITAKDGVKKDAMASAYGLPAGRQGDKYYCSDYSGNILYTETDYGDGPYPADEILTMDPEDWSEMEDNEKEQYHLVYANYYDEQYGYVTYPVLVDAPLIAPACIVKVVNDYTWVDVTISNQGVLAKDKDGDAAVEMDVRAIDYNGDDKITVDEALLCAHEQYFEDGADGYATVPNTPPYEGVMVTKLWGVDTRNTLFYVDGVSVYPSVDAVEVEEDQSIYASVNKDNEYYSDYYTRFTQRYYEGCRAQKFKFTLEGQPGMAGGEMKPLEGIQLGFWNKEDGFTPIDGAVTDKNGEVTVTIPEEGEYLVTAQGTVKDEVTDWGTGQTIEYDCPMMAPYAFLEVYENEDEEAACPVREAIDALPEAEDSTLQDKEAVQAAMALYKGLTDDQRDYITYSQELKIQIAVVTIDKLQAQQDAKAAADKLAEAKKKLNEALGNDPAVDDIDKLTDQVKVAEADLKELNDEIAVLTVQAQQVTGVKAKGKKKKAQVSWKSLGSGYTYEVYKSTKLNGKYKKAKTTTSKKAVIKKLKSKKTYYVKVRAYKKVNGKKVYTKFSEIKSVKAK